MAATEVKPGLFTVRLFDATVINENQIGLVEALDGAPLNPGDYVAESVPGHDNFQDGHEFIDGKGQRGPQKDILLPGTYYINPLLFKVIPETAKEVKPGEVAVIVSNTGKDPSEEIRRQMAAKVRERMEREEKEQAEQSAARLDKMDDKRTAEEIKNELDDRRPRRPTARRRRARSLCRARRLSRHPGNCRWPGPLLREHAGHHSHRYSDNEPDRRMDRRARWPTPSIRLK